MSDLKYLEGLNTAQLEAVNYLEGPLLIVAGAGTGKTRTLVTRLAHIINLGLARPYEILAVTFTNKAANELKHRIQSLTGIDPLELSWVGTFHSMAAKILKIEAERIGLNSNFTILDDNDQTKIVKELLKSKNITPEEIPPRMLTGQINKWKNDAKTPSNLTKQDKELFQDRAENLYQSYQRELLQSNCVDFGDLLLHVVTLFTKQADVLKTYQDKFFYIMVDEYQDTNICQYQMLRLLTQRKKKNICCVGDDDQAIYSWRGARPQIMLNFSEHFKDAKIVKLEENYRSTKHILGAGVGLIQQNLMRHDKTLRVGLPGTEQVNKVRVHVFDELFAESKFIGNAIKKLNTTGIAGRKFSYSEIAVAARTWSETADIEECFFEMKIPYRVIGGPKFFDRKEIKDVIGYLKVSHNPLDNFSLARIINTPTRGIGKVTHEKISLYASEHNISHLEAARKLVLDKGLATASSTKLGKFLSLLEEGSRKLNDPTLLLSNSINTLVSEIGYKDYLVKNYPENFEDRIENVEKLSDMAGRYETLGGFIEQAGLMNAEEDPDDHSNDQVSLMTLHACKGSEYPAMYLIGWYEGGLPLSRTIEERYQVISPTVYQLAMSLLYNPPKNTFEIRRFLDLAKFILQEVPREKFDRDNLGKKLAKMILKGGGIKFSKEEQTLAKKITTSEAIEEERRLAHVGITRAKELCVISYNQVNMFRGQFISGLLPSRFINELPNDDVEHYVKERLASRESISTQPSRPQKTIQNGRRSFTPKVDKTNSISEGDRVLHKVFGKGSVIASSNNRLLIKFDNNQEKLILNDYVTLL
ncbi:MAG: UvrD-helicase domain-containing protein [Paracoccaceae bacterium]|nr:UvrD-helicase domain-containing protein [Paracoccaceae bacterium]MDE2675953.1 UvrD-helicase domain-containing protein [Paracoccaceae bacterium]